jgi:ethanolamine utilization protein EutM
MKKALGMIETVGLVPLMEAADAVGKAADVKLLRWESAGSGMVTAFFEGDVAAVKAAVDAGAEAASHIGKVVSAQVIANPHEGLAAFTTVKKAGKA